jgi:hypothetical protein
MPEEADVPLQRRCGRGYADADQQETAAILQLPRQSRAPRPRGNGLDTEADARIRTADPFITSEVLYQLSYVGKCA